ncbi:MAG: ABC transporter permease [Candidatus Promineifilaceae bacterium]
MKMTRQAQPIYRQIYALFLMEITNWRWSWRGLVLLGMVTPLLSMLALGIFARDSGSEALNYVLTGNVVVALMFGIQNSVESRFVFLKLNGSLSFYATLPVQKLALVLAVILAFFLLSLPSVIVTILLGSVLLGVTLQVHWLILVVIPLCAVSVAGIGALIGASAQTLESGSAMNLLVTFVMMSLGAVVVPPEKLPELLVFFGRISPATYAASALRQTLLGPLTTQLWIDLIALGIFTFAVFWMVERKLDWRER